MGAARRAGACHNRPPWANAPPPWTHRRSRSSARSSSCAESRGATALSAAELERLPRLYRFASSLVARLATSGHDPAALARARALVGRAHALLYRELPRTRGSLVARALRFLVHDSARAIRAEWKVDRRGPRPVLRPGGARVLRRARGPRARVRAAARASRSRSRSSNSQRPKPASRSAATSPSGSGRVAGSVGLDHGAQHLDRA